MRKYVQAIPNSAILALFPSESNDNWRGILAEQTGCSDVGKVTQKYSGNLSRKSLFFLLLLTTVAINHSDILKTKLRIFSP